jgi:hypothetical protein
MATKNNSLDNLDFDNLSFDSLDSGDMGRTKDDRKAIAKATSSFAKGVRESFVRPENIRTLAANALPRGYGTAISTTTDAARGAGELYNIAIKELRPALPAMRRMTNRMLPHTQRYLPAIVTKQLERFANTRESAGYSQQQADDDTLSQSIGDIFKINMEHTERARVEDKTERMIHDKVMDIRARGQVNLLQGIRDNTERLVAYQDRVTHRFQQKSLELQWRSYFVQRDTLKLLMGDSDRDKILLEAIMKNTALPEVQKIKMSERAGGMLRDKIMSSVASGASDYARNFLKNILKNVGDSVRGTSANAAQGIMAADDAAQMSDMMGDMGGGSAMETIMNAIGGVAGQKAMAWGGNALRKHTSKNAKLARKGNEIEYFLSNYATMANKWSRSDKGESGNMGFLVRLLKSFVPGFALDSSLKGSPILGLDQPATFDDHTRRSIVEVIPGFLSRIHNELAKIRTGDNNLEPVEYNLDRGLFTGRSVRIKDMTSRILNPHSATNVNDAIDRLMKNAKLDGKLSKETEAAFKRQIMVDSLSGYDGGLDPKRYGTSSRENLSLLNMEQRREIEKALGSHFEDDTKANIVESSRLMKDVRGRMPDPRAQMLAYQQVGMLPELREMGLAIGDGLNNKINYEKWAQMFGGATMSPEDFAKMNQTSGDGSRSKNMAMGRAMVIARRKLKKTGTKTSDAIKSIYADGIDSPILDEVKAKAGHYIDVSTQKVVNTFDDIKGDVMDVTTGESVFTIDRLKKGLVDKLGNPIQGLSVNKIQAHLSRARSAAERILKPALSSLTPQLSQLRNRVKGVMSDAQQTFDVYAQGSKRLLISASKLRSGEYRDQLTQKPVLTIDDISGPVVDQDNEVVLSAQDVKDGLVDSKGQPLRALAERIFRNVRSMTSSAQSQLPNFMQPKGVGAATPEINVQSDQGELVRLNSEQVVLLQAIHQTLMAGIAVNASGGQPTPTGYFGKFGQKLRSMFSPGKLIKGGAGATAMAGKGVLNYLKWSYSTMWSGAKTGVQSLLGIGGTARDVITDVRAKGSTRILLHAAKMRNGDYRDARNPSKVIKTFKDIRGPVIDELGNEVLSAEDYAKGLYDTFGRRITRGAFGILGAGLKMIGGALGVYSSGVRFLYDTASAALRLPGKILKAWNEPKDVYVADDLKTPKLRASLMKAGFYRIRGSRNQLVTSHMDALKGEVEDRSGNLLISHEDHQKGLCDYRGKPFRSLTGRAVDAMKWAGGWALRGAKGYADLVWGGVGAVKNMALGVLGIPGRLRGEGSRWFSHSEKVMNVLIAIHDLLDKRMPGTKFTKGSWQDQMSNAKDKAKEKTSAAKEASKEKNSPLAKLIGLFSSMNPFGGGDEEDESDEDGDGGDTTIIGGMGGDGKKGPSKDSRWGRYQRGRKAKRLRAARAAARGGGGKFARLMRKMPGLGKLGKFKLGLGALAASVGLGMFGDKLPKPVQSGISAGGTALTAYQGASWLSTLLGGGSATATAGTAAAATGTAATAAGTTAAATTAATGVAAGGLTAGGALSAVGTTLGGIAASPVLIPAAIIAAAVGVGYMTYRYNKYHAKQPIRHFRMMQYGFDDKEKDYLVPIVKLEEYLQDKVKLTNRL